MIKILKISLIGINLKDMIEIHHDTIMASKHLLEKKVDKSSGMG
jgi:hypothetical protein